MKPLRPVLWALLTLCASPAFSHDDVAQLIAKLDAVRVENGIAGVSVALASRDAVLWMGGLGVMAWDRPTPVSQDTIFRIGSVTKMFTAAALLRLQQEGRLRLSDPVRQHAPNAPFTNPWEATHPVRVDQLLEHTAGLQDLTKEEFDSSDPRPLTLEEGLALRADSRIVRWKPGLHASYSNAGYGLAGYVIEQVVGQPYEDVMQTRLFDALGMRSSGFFRSDAARARFATGYESDGRTPSLYWHMIMRPFGGMHTTARDMAVFLQMLLSEGRTGDRQLLTPDSVRRLETPATTLAARSGLRFGYALGIHQYLYRGYLFYGHSGDADGYLAHVGYNRDFGFAYYIAINRCSWPALVALRRVIEAWIVQDAAKPLPPGEPSLPETLLRAYAGRYEPATSRYDGMNVEERAQQIVRIDDSAGKLYTQTASGSRQALIPVSETLFRREDEPVATCAFVRDEDGQLYFQNLESYARIAGP